IEPSQPAEDEPGIIVGDACEPSVLARADLASAVGLVAGTDNDTTNLSMLAAARQVNPDLFLAARQNRPTSSAMFEAMEVDALLRSPEDRDRRLRVVPLLLLRDVEAVLAPPTDTVLAPDDELLFAGEASQRRQLEGTMVVDSTAALVLFGQRVPASWVWRALS